MNKQINTLTKELIMENYKSIKKFIHHFEGGANDENEFYKLIFKLDSNRLVMPTEVQNVFDDFVEVVLHPMVFDFESVLPSLYSTGHFESNCFRVDNVEAFKQELQKFIDTISEIEKLWDGQARKELLPYLI